MPVEEEACRRVKWRGRLDFILSLLCYTVGIANIWRFPFKAYENGGAAFVLVYIVLVVIIGLPYFLMECGFGQYGGLGVIKIWRALPLFEGIGYAMVFTSAVISTYYGILLAYSLHYFFASFNSELPWQRCSEEWTQQHACVDEPSNLTTLARSPSQIHWETTVLDRSSGINDGVDEIKWDLCLTLLFLWIVTFFVLIKGIRSSGKVAYITSTVPIVILIIILVRNTFLAGAMDGIDYFIQPEWSLLLNAKVWYEAAAHVFFTLSLATGGIQNMAGYNRFTNNFYRDTFIAVLVDTAVSLLAGFAVFTMIGHMADKYASSVDVILQEQGQGVVFVVYSEALRLLPIPQLWSALFFLMFFIIGLGAQFIRVDFIATSLVDEIPVIRKWRHKYIVSRSVMCIVIFSSSIPLTSRAGVYIFHLLDALIPFFAVVGIGLVQIIAISWIYGFKRLSANFMEMIGADALINRCFCPIWWPFWVFITPASIAFTLIFGIVDYQPVQYGVGDRAVHYPKSAEAIAFSIVGTALGLIFARAVVVLLKACCCGPTNVLKSTGDWGKRTEECPVCPKTTIINTNDVSNKVKDNQVTRAHDTMEMTSCPPQRYGPIRRSFESSQNQTSEANWVNREQTSGYDVNRYHQAGNTRRQQRYFSQPFSWHTQPVHYYSTGSTRTGEAPYDVQQNSVPMTTGIDCYDNVTHSNISNFNDNGESNNEVTGCTGVTDRGKVQVRVTGDPAIIKGIHVTSVNVTDDDQPACY